MICPFGLDNPKQVIEFEEVDPYNPKNTLKGFVNRRQGHLYGSLYITHVNNKPCPQVIYSAPKQHYPFNKDDEWKFPECDCVELYTKIDGTCIISYVYKDEKGHRYLTYKTRLRPFLGSEGKKKHILHHWVDMKNREIKFLYWDDENGKVFEVTKIIERKYLMNKHRIYILSIPDLYRQKDHLDKEDTMVIQIQHHNKNKHPVIKMKYAKVNSFIFDDESKDRFGFITKQTTKHIIQLAKRLSKLNTHNIYVCCYAGLSRSPAVAIALNEILHKETKDSYYDFRAADVMDCCHHYNKDISDYIRKIYEAEE